MRIHWPFFIFPQKKISQVKRDYEYLLRRVTKYAIQLFADNHFAADITCTI